MQLKARILCGAIRGFEDQVYKILECHLLLRELNDYEDFF